MPTTRTTTASLLLALVLVAVTGCATPPPDPTPVEKEPLGPPMAYEPCVAEAIGLDAAAWRDHVRDLRELVVLAEPEHEALATVGMTMRLTAIDRRERRMRWLLEQDPTRFDVDGDAQAFRTFGWSDEDDAALAEVDPTVLELTARADELGAQYANSPKRELFVEWYNAELLGSDGYRVALADLRERERRVERMLERCEPYGAEAADEPDTPASGEAATADGG